MNSLPKLHAHTNGVVPNIISFFMAISKTSLATGKFKDVWCHDFNWTLSMLGQVRYGHYVNRVGKIATGCIYMFPDIRLLICSQHLRVWEQRASWQPKMFPLMLTCQSIAYQENLKLASVNSSGHADPEFQTYLPAHNHQSMVLAKIVFVSSNNILLCFFFQLYFGEILPWMKRTWKCFRSMER